jgi:hypothetical protein
MVNLAYNFKRFASISRKKAPIAAAICRMISINLLILTHHRQYGGA